MGDRKPKARTERRGVGGRGSRSIDLTTGRYDPFGVTFHCTSVYVCSPIACVRSPIAAKIAMCPTQSRRWPRKPKPRERGFNRGLLRGWGLREAHCHQNNVDATTPFPFENQKQRECGAFPPSLGARPALRFPRSPPADSHCRQARWRKGGTAGLIHMNGAAAGLIGPGGGAGGRARPSKQKVQKASEMADRTAQGLVDKSVPVEEQQRRKRAVIKGPKEFRDIREDLHKPKKR